MSLRIQEGQPSNILNKIMLKNPTEGPGSQCIALHGRSESSCCTRLANEVSSVKLSDEGLQSCTATSLTFWARQHSKQEIDDDTSVQITTFPHYRQQFGQKNLDKASLQENLTTEIPEHSLRTYKWMHHFDSTNQLADTP